MTERILTFGPQGAGKTRQVLETAKYLRPTGAQFYVLDTDDSYPRSLEEFPGLAPEVGGNVHVTFAFNWEDYVNWLEDTLAKLKPTDWLVVDRVDKAWSRVQNYFAEEVYGQSQAERLLKARKNMAGKRAMVVSANDQADWQTINAQYNGWFMKLMYKSRCNIYLCASAVAVRSDDDAQLRDTYGPVGARPEGQKGLPYEPHTVLYLVRDRQGDWRVTTVKDRGRKYMDQTKLVNLPIQYLRAIGGWSVEVASNG